MALRLFVRKEGDPLVELVRPEIGSEEERVADCDMYIVESMSDMPAPKEGVTYNLYYDRGIGLPYFAEAPIDFTKVEEQPEEEVEE